MSTVTYKKHMGRNLKSLLFLILVASGFFIGSYFPHIVKGTFLASVLVSTNTEPKGSVEGLTCENVYGWAYDADSPERSVSVQVYVDATAGVGGEAGLVSTGDASGYRSDLCSTLQSCNHGFYIPIPARLSDGLNHTVYIYARDANAGTQTLIGSPWTMKCGGTPVIGTGNRGPRGSIDTLSCEYLKGWVQDQDFPDTALEVKVYADTPLGADNDKGYLGSTLADQRLAALCTSIGSCNHGYSFPFPSSLIDNQAHLIYIYATDPSGGSVIVGSPRAVQCFAPVRSSTATSSGAFCPQYQIPACAADEYVSRGASTGGCPAQPTCAKITPNSVLYTGASSTPVRIATTTSQKTSSQKACVTLARNLQPGMRGSDVRALQEFLIAQELLEDDSATGYFGSLTTKAVQEVQKNRIGLASGSPTENGFGAVGPRTRGAIQCN